MYNMTAILPIGAALFLFIAFLAVLVWLIVRVISLGNEVEQLKQRHNTWVAQAPGSHQPGYPLNQPHGEYVTPRAGETRL